jgi:hypothetical protein
MVAAGSYHTRTCMAITKRLAVPPPPFPAVFPVDGRSKPPAVTVLEDLEEDGSSQALKRCSSCDACDPEENKGILESSGRICCYSSAGLGAVPEGNRAIELERRPILRS